MKKQIIGIAGIVAAVVIMGCSSGKKVEEGEDFIYGINSSGTALEEIPYEFSEKEGDKAVSAMLKELAKEPDNIDYQAAIPNAVQVLSYEIQENQLQLNFSASYNQLSNVEEVLVRAAVVKSLVQIKGVEYVAFYVEEIPLTYDSGNPIGIMKDDDFVKNTGSSVNSYQAATLNLYFANETGDRLVKETVNVRYSSNISMEKLIIERLMKGPSSDNAYPVIKKEVKLLGVSVKNNICYVNFDKGFLTAGYDLKPIIPIYAIVNSIIEGTNVSQVQISINGETDVVYLGEVNLGQPLARNLDLVEGENK